jgi:cation diffusion facilitator CzcD-associated flavoprotein CzcO
MHSAEWDPAYDWSGRDVIVVGSAASAIQIVPQLAQSATRVTVMQRSANYFIPRKDRAVSAFERWLFRNVPGVQRLFRWRQYLFNDFLFHANFVTRGSPAKWYVHRLVRKHLRRSVADPVLREQLTPDYEIGCKRVLLSDDFLPAVQRDNVELVTEGIGRFTETGLVTAQGREIAADLVVLATGFRTTKLFGDMDVTGPDGLTMDRAWAGGIRAHRSVAVKDFPNLFMMYGPNSNLGHSSIIIMIEAQANCLARLLRHARDRGATSVTVRPEAEERWNSAIQQALQKTVWATGCKSWYKDERGHIFSLWPHSTTRFMREMRKAPLDEFRFDRTG